MSKKRLYSQWGLGVLIAQICLNSALAGSFPHSCIPSLQKQAKNISSSAKADLICPNTTYILNTLVTKDQGGVADMVCKSVSKVGELFTTSDISNLTLGLNATGEGKVWVQISCKINANQDSVSVPYSAYFNVFCAKNGGLFKQVDDGGLRCD